MTIVEIAAIVTAASALGALVTSLINAGKISTVHLSINSRMDELLKASDLVARAAGREEGRQEGRFDASSLIKAAALVEKQRKEKD